MILPKHLKNSQSGQILIIFLLILVVGLAITLSIASRTVTDVRQTTTSDESNRAYFAAEAGVENALKKIEDGSIPPTGGTANIDLTTVNRSKADVGVVALSVPSGTAFEFPNKIAKDEVAQVNLLDNFNLVTTAGNGGAKSVKRTDGLVIYWANPGTKPAIEVSIITCEGTSTNCGPTPSFNIYKWTFDQDAVAHGNNFCASVNPTGSQTTTLGSGRPFDLTATFNFTVPQCNNDVFGANNHPVLARIRILYGGPTQLAVKTVSGADLPDQGSKITSIGKTASGVTRKLTVTRLYPALPAIFDYVLYNGSSSQPLSKP